MQSKCRTLILCLSLLLVSCTPESKPSGHRTIPTPSAATAQGCAAKGGTLQRVCRRQVEACVVPFSDAGKACSDKSQCQGRCILDSDHPVSVGDSVMGKCELDNDPCGCKIEVVNGKVGGGVCVD